MIGTVHVDQYTFFIILPSIILRMRNDSFEFCREKKTYFLFNTLYWKLMPFMRQCGKIWKSQTGHRYQYNMVHALCILDN